MNKFGVLMRLFIRNRLAALRGGLAQGQTGKAKAGKIAAAVLVALAYLVILGMIIGFEFLLFEGLKALGQPELLLSMTLTVVMAGMVLMSFFYVLTSLYYGRDVPFLASLPTTSRSVFGAKLTEVLLGETGIAAVALLPAVTLYGIHVGAGAAYYLRAALVVLTSAMLPVAVVALLSTLIVRLTGGSRHRDAVMMVYSIAILVGVLWLEFSFMGRMPEDAGPAYFLQLMMDREGLMRQLAQAFPPSWWAMQGLQGELWPLLGYLACALGGYGSVWFWLGGKYLTRSLALTENAPARRRGRQRREIRPHKPLTSLFLREWREILRTPAYAYNCLSGVILIPVMTAAMLISGSQAAEAESLGAMLSMTLALLEQVPGAYLCLGITALMAFVCCVNPAVDTAVSREGGRHMLSRMLPVKPETQLQAKLLMGMSVNLFSCVVGAVMLSCIAPRFIGVIALAFLLTQVANLALSSFSLCLDATRPHFHWRNEMQAIKQNNNVALGMLASLLLLLIPGAAFFLTGGWSLGARTALVIALCLAEAAAGYALLMRVARGPYAALEDTGA